MVCPSSTCRVAFRLPNRFINNWKVKKGYAVRYTLKTKAILFKTGATWLKENGLPFFPVDLTLDAVAGSLNHFPICEVYLLKNRHNSQQCILWLPSQYSPHTHNIVYIFFFSLSVYWIPILMLLCESYKIRIKANKSVDKENIFRIFFSFYIFEVKN